MKEFRKTQDDLFICEECGKTWKRKGSLSFHITQGHNLSLKNYYDKWLKDETDVCKICRKKTEYKNFHRGYRNWCSVICRNKYNVLKTEEACLKLFGVKNNFQRHECKQKAKQTKKERYEDENFNNMEKIKQTKRERYGNENFNNLEKNRQTCKQKYGVENVFQLEKCKKKAKQTKKERYGDENFLNIEKTKQTNLKNLGTEWPLSNKEVYKKAKYTKKQKYGDENYNNPEKIKQTNLKNIGVEWPSQNREILKKQQKTAKRIKLYKNTNIWYQGSYELDFLEKYHDEYPDIQRGPTIKYLFEGKQHYHFPDFYIPSLNLIIECKNSYLAKKCKKQIDIEKQFILNEGYNYIIIINRDYILFEKFLNK